jgi:hypothetical protein
LTTLKTVSLKTMTLKKTSLTNIPDWQGFESKKRAMKKITATLEGWEWDFFVNSKMPKEVLPRLMER